MPDAATQAQDDWGGCTAAAVTERLVADHNREMDEQQAHFVRAQQKQSPFAQAVEQLECIMEHLRACGVTLEAALAPVQEAYPDVRLEMSTEGQVFVRSDGTRIAHETIDTDRHVQHMYTAHKSLCADVNTLRKHALAVARRKPGDRGAVLPPRIATRVQMLLTVTLPCILKSARADGMRFLRDYVRGYMHLMITDRLGAARELCDNLMAVLWDESLIMPLQPPAIVKFPLNPFQVVTLPSFVS